MTWIDYRKAYEMVPHCWIEECLNIFGITEDIKTQLSESMKSWRTELTSGSDVYGDVQIQRGLFKGDIPSPLLLVIAMIPLNLPLRKSRFAYDFNKKLINQPMFIDNLKLKARREQGLEQEPLSLRMETRG